MKKTLLIFLTFSLLAASSWAADKKTMRASNVGVSKATSGVLAPTSRFVGSINYTEISKTASESSGLILSVNTEEGSLVRRGERLAIIDSTLLEKTLEQNVAELEQIEANLEKASRDFSRSSKLFKKNAISEQAFDNSKYSSIALEKQKAAKIAAIDHLKAQLDKKLIKAPFDGVIISKKISKGDWVASGSIAFEIAKSGSVDAIVNVPQEKIGFLSKNLDLTAMINHKPVNAKLHSIIPKGDTQTRSFPVKFRIADSKGLFEGMKVEMHLPSAAPVDVIFINRDAVVKAMGNVIVYTIVEGKAKPIPVQIVGYKGNTVGLKSQFLKAGMTIIVKGNERIRPDQPVQPTGK